MSAQMIQMVGSALLHFFWQGAALAVLFLMAISVTRNPRIRYGLGVATLVLMALCPLLTFALLERPTPAVTTANDATSIVAPAVSNVTFALTSAAPVSSFDLLSCFVSIWCGGVCLFALRAFGGWFMLQGLRRTAQEAVSAALLESCRRLQQRIGIKALVRYAHSEVVDAPAVVGWFRPVVLIPLSAMSGLSTEQLEAIIAHELAHIRRFDALVNLFQIATETVLFYHPAIWWVNRVIRTERENCCDDIAVSVCGNATEYARALAMMSGAARPTWAMAANGGALKARIGRLLGMQKITHGIPRAGLAVLALLCASCILLASGSFKQEPPPVPPAPAPPPAAATLPEPPVPAAPALPSSATLPSPAPVAAPQPPPPPADLATPNDEDLVLLEKREIDAKVKALLRKENKENIEQLQRSISSLAQRYTTDFPELVTANRRLAALMARSLQSADQKPEEHKGPSYIDSLASAGLTNLTVEDIIALKTQGVSADYIRGIKAAGFEPSIHELIGLKVQGISPEYIQAIRATGIKPNLHELIGMKVQGVTPEFVRAMQSAGLGDLRINDYTAAKIQGVTPEFIEKVRSHGFKNLTFHQLLSLKMADVF